MVSILTNFNTVKLGSVFYFSYICKTNKYICRTNKDNMSVIEILVGISGSGKSTYARNLVKTDPSWVRLNRDDIRTTLFGVEQSDQSYYQRKDLKECEKLVSEVIYQSMYDIIHKDKNIVLDNTHLEKKYVDDVYEKYGHLADISIRIFDIDMDMAVSRVQARGTEDTSYIGNQVDKFKKLKKSLFGKQMYTFKQDYSVPYSKLKKDVFLCDLDGTLALKFSGRDIFDESKVDLDTPIVPVKTVIKSLQDSGHRVIFMSGRKSSSRDLTQAWLETQGIWTEDSELHMRGTMDNRKDSKVKEDLFYMFIEPYYNVLGVFDDRLQVARMWEKLGIFVFNTNQGLKQF